MFYINNELNMINIQMGRNFYRLAVITLVMLSFCLPFLIPSNAKAATLSQTFIRFDRLQTSTPTTGTVCVNQTSGGTDASVQVTFPTGYTVSSSTGNWTVGTTNTGWPSGGTAWPGIGTATNVSGQVVTFPSTTLTAGTVYCFNWVNSAAVSTASGASNTNTGTIGTYTSTPTLIDSGTYVTSTVTNDQIVVSATVPQAFSFALSANTDPLGTLSTASVSSSPTPRTVTINTNAKNGWMVWSKDSNTGLTSASASATIASTTPGSNSTLSAGTAGYNTGITSSQANGTGTISVATAFVGGSTGKGGGLNTSYATLASSNGTGASSVLTLTNNLAIGATTPAATDYTDTVTVVGAGLF
jgi:hypothetical protein